MVHPDKKKDLLSRVPEGATKVEVRTFDPARDSLAAFVEEIRKPLLRVSDKPLQVSIVAPQHFLKRDGINAEEFPSTRQFAGLRLFADCCTIENVGIKECQNTVSQVLRELALLSRETLEQCPFIASKDGIHSITLSFIPEKYRLDIQRSEEILERNLLRWLDVVKGKETVEESRKLNEKQRKVLIR
jgi:ATP-dependent Lon protease